MITYNIRISACEDAKQPQEALAAPPSVAAEGPGVKVEHVQHQHQCMSVVIAAWQGVGAPWMSCDVRLVFDMMGYIASSLS